MEMVLEKEETITVLAVENMTQVTIKPKSSHDLHILEETEGKLLLKPGKWRVSATIKPPKEIRSRGEGKLLDSELKSGTLRLKVEKEK